MSSKPHTHAWHPLLAGLLLLPAAAGCAGRGPAAPAPVPLPELAYQVEIRRTEHGVPHILAQNLRAAGFALAYVQLEDYGARIIEGFQAARGRMALIDGPRRIEADARARLRHARATETFASLKQDTRATCTTASRQA
jgi:acyl-homoserine-lactone acylase